MNKFRLNSQYNYIEIFDSFEKHFSCNKVFFNFFISKVLKIQVINLEKSVKLILDKCLFLELLTGQRKVLNKKIKKDESFFKITIKKKKIFFFLEIIFHSIFMEQQFTKKLQNIKVANLVFFLPYTVLEKLLLQLSIYNNISILI
uniref:Uncharacterized protein n=1 Tax=Gracilaria edulis TaxID=172966 RepID=A0A2S1PUL1_9FLOR|nr:hypothetical protein GreduCDS01 [Gracilaria edulis]AWH62516.1 hypothetical protein GreduCDS01 [Gracilaria edulis]